MALLWVIKTQRKEEALFFLPPYKKTTFTCDLLLKSMKPQMKGKKDESEPEYFHWPECVYVLLRVYECEPWMCQREGVWKRPDVECQTLVCPAPSIPSVLMMDDGEWEVSSPGSLTAAGCRQKERPSAFHCRGRWGPSVLGLEDFNIIFLFVICCFGSRTEGQTRPGPEVSWAAEASQAGTD